MSLEEYAVEVIEDDYGKESFEAKIYYHGPWDYGGSSRSLRVHINCDEEIIFKPNRSEIFHSYSDRIDLPNTTISVYTLEEVVVEKLRAISAQRRWAIGRDFS